MPWNLGKLLSELKARPISSAPSSMKCPWPLQLPFDSTVFASPHTKPHLMELVPVCGLWGQLISLLERMLFHWEKRPAWCCSLVLKALAENGEQRGIPSMLEMDWHQRSWGKNWGLLPTPTPLILQLQIWYPRFPLPSEIDGSSAGSWSPLCAPSSSLRL